MNGKGVWWAIGLLMLLVLGSFAYTNTMATIQSGSGERISKVEEQYIATQRTLEEIKRDLRDVRDRLERGDRIRTNPGRLDAR